MIVPVSCECGECPPWLMVELQGELSLRDPDSMTGEGFDVGVMCMKGKSDVSMTIGYHQLEGKVMPLKKPLVIMEKTSEGGEEDAHNARYNVAGVIRSKVLFKNRPKALISKPQSNTR